MANRRISELPLIEGDLVAEEDLFTLVHVYEVDPSLKNKRITVSGLKNYLNNYYLNTSENDIAISGKDLTINGVRVGRGAGALDGNTVVGNLALNVNTTGFQNTAVGANVLRVNIDGNYNTGVGLDALYSNTNGSASVAMGLNALRSNTSGDGNTAIGVNALLVNVSGDYNTAIGENALYSNTSGNYNVGIGDNALYFHTSGSYNVGIGAGVSLSSSTVSNEVNISNGSVTARFQGAASAWNFVSDARDKTNIQDLTIGLDFITALKPRKFEWNLRHTEIDKGKPAAGFIAQELLETIENFDASYVNLVHTDNPEQFTFAQANMVPVLVNAVKELSAMVKELQAAVLKGV